MGAAAVPLLIGIGSSVAGGLVSKMLFKDKGPGAPPPAPTTDPEAARRRSQQAADQQRKRAAAGQGRAGTIATGSGLGDLPEANRQTTTLLGY
jgi:hypothetical protein